MTILVMYLLTALDTALVIWGQQTFPPITPTFPPPPTMNAVINGSVVVLAGEPVTIGDNQRVTIDCSEVIDRAIMSGIPNPTVKWFRDGNMFSNGNVVISSDNGNVVISSDRRRLIITDTLLAVGGQLGNEGNYTCDVCTDFMDSNCNITTPVCVCGGPNISPPTGPAVVTPGFIGLTCGQDVVVPTLQGVAILLFQCNIFNGSSPVSAVFKDGVQINDNFQLVVPFPSDADFGTYTFRVSTECCGSTVVVSRIIRQADPPDIDEGPFIPQPPFVRPGDMTVRINTPAYIVDGFILTLVCRLVSGTRPITIMWFRNGHPYPAGGHNSRITVSDYEDDEIFTCRAVNIVGFDMENTTVNVINGSEVVLVGEPVTVSNDIRVVIDCGQLINRAIMSGIPNPTVNWLKDGNTLMNGSAPFVVVSSDRRHLIITDTLLAIDGHLGNEGNYTCDVCTDFMDPNCNITTPVCVCGEPNISPPTFPALIAPDFITLTCGQDIEVPTLERVTLVFHCSIFNGSNPVSGIFKDGVRIHDSFPLLISPASDDDFGTYTFRLSTECCGSTMAVSRIIRQSFAPDIDKGVERPLSASRGVIRVKIGTPVYITDMFSVTIDCNITRGTHPITLRLYHNNALVNQTRGNASSITIPVTNAANIHGDVYTCIAVNFIGFDIMSTTIYYLKKTEFCIIP